MRLTLCEAPTRETRPDHNTGNFIHLLFSFQSFKNIKDYIDYAKSSQDLSIVAGGKCDDR